MNQRSKKALLRFGFFGVGLALVAACGGRAMIEEGGGAGTGAVIASAGMHSGSAGTASSHGGTASSHGGMASTFAGTTSVYGGATSTTGGTGSTFAGAGGCPATACPFLPACNGPNEMYVTPPGQCCPVCQTTCPPCGDVACPSGYSSQMIAGQCCPTCVIDNCAAGKMSYASTHAAFLDKYSRGCTTDADCVVDSPANACESGCSTVAIWQPVLHDWQDNLASAAVSDCSSCAPTPVPPCLPNMAPPACKGGQCVLPLR